MAKYRYKDSTQPEAEWPHLWILPSGTVVNGGEITAVTPATQDSPAGVTKTGVLIAFREGQTMFLGDRRDTEALMAHLLGVAVELDSPYYASGSGAPAPSFPPAEPKTEPMAGFEDLPEAKEQE